MAIGYLTSDTLIASIKRRALIPSNQRTFQDSDFLSLANEEIDMGLVPSILQYHEEFFAYETSVALSANKSNYSIPYRAIGNKFRDVVYEDSQGNLAPMTRIQPEERIEFQNDGSTTGANAYYIRGNEIILVPEIGPSPTGNLIFIYYLRPNDLVDEDRVGEITAFNTSTGVITMSTFPTQFAIGGKIDLLQVKSGHKTRAFDLTITAVDSTLKTVTISASSLPSDLEVGDHVVSAGECKVPQIPSDLHPVLAQRVAARCLEALGDSQGLTNANTKLQEMEQKTGSLIDNRSEGHPQKLNNLKSPLQQLFRRRSW